MGGLVALVQRELLSALDSSQPQPDHHLLGPRALHPGSSPSPTSSAAAMQTSKSPTSSAPPAATTSDSGGGGGSPASSSPLLFFVALGFGVVFTNLWIIVGVKYCFRYNQRNRQARGPDDPADMIDMGAMRRPGRRRREKKLMSMDDVNERFPLIKYKSWRATRESEGLPTAGGVAAPSDATAATILPTSHGVADSERGPSTEVRKSHEEPRQSTTEAPVQTTPETVPVPESTDAAAAPPAAEEAAVKKSTDTQRETKKSEEAGPEIRPSVEEPQSPSTSKDHKRDTMIEDEEDEDDHTRTAVPAELLTDPGDSCAICLDILEDDDDVRGLTCGHAFHASCLDPWLTSRRACCPLCKTDYYVPKPRPEGTNAPTGPGIGSEGGDRTGRTGGAGTRGRTGGPREPSAAWIGSRANAFGTRIMLPSRFATPAFGSEHDRYGFPMVSRERRRRASERNVENGDVSYTEGPGASNGNDPSRSSRPSWLRVPFRNRGAEAQTDVSYTSDPAQQRRNPSAAATSTTAGNENARPANAPSQSLWSRFRPRPRGAQTGDIQDGMSDAPRAPETTPSRLEAGR